MQNTLLRFALLAISVLLLGNENGALPENTGAPNEFTCGRAPCHNIPANIGAAQIGIVVADSIFHYQSDSVYLIKIRITNPLSAKNGFEILALNANLQNAGQWILQAPNQTKIIPGISFPQRKYVTHTAAGNQQTEWLVKWKAPSTGSSDITFYASVLSANNNGQNTGDQLYTTTTKLNFSTVSTNEFDFKNQIRVFPNPAADQFRIINQSPFPIDEVVLWTSDGCIARVFTAPDPLANLSLASLPPGIYCLKIRTPNRSIVQKMCVE